jgi:hypothetical protein
MSRRAVIQLRAAGTNNAGNAEGVVMRASQRVDGCAASGPPLSRTAGTTGDSCGFWPVAFATRGRPRSAANLPAEQICRQRRLAVRPRKRVGQTYAAELGGCSLRVGD